jgi:hypothetical protein
MSSFHSYFYPPHLSASPSVPSESLNLLSNSLERNCKHQSTVFGRIFLSMFPSSGTSLSLYLPYVGSKSDTVLSAVYKILSHFNLLAWKGGGGGGGLNPGPNIL